MDKLEAVARADREAYLQLNNLPPQYAEPIRAGEWDGVTGIQILACHRAAGIREGLEMAAKFADQLHEGYKSGFEDAGIAAKNRETLRTQAGTSRHIAAAIRSLKDSHPTPDAV